MKTSVFLIQLKWFFLPRALDQGPVTVTPACHDLLVDHTTVIVIARRLLQPLKIFYPEAPFVDEFQDAL